MEHAFWEQRWREGQTGWHRDSVNPWLVRHLGRLAPMGSERVLVPLCGKSLDLGYLAGEGYEAVGVELVEQGVRELFAERGVEPRESRAGRLRRFEGAGVTVFQGDFFDVTRDHLGEVRAVFDRGAMIALPAEVRGRYVAHLRSLLAPGARVLLLTLTYDQARAEGPPFSVTEDEVRQAYAGSSVEVLERDPESPAPPRFQESGIEHLVDTTYLIALDGP